MELIRNIANDTLKKTVDGVRRWDRMKLTMFTAWLISCFMALRDYYFTGLRYDVLVLFVGVALGSKVIDGLSKKLEK
jgi:hypothetical protein